jgi:hypothetical protein
MGGTFDTSVRSYRFYRRSSALVPGLVVTANFADCKLVLIDMGDGKTNFISQGIIIANDHGANEIQFSFDGVSVEGDLLANESMNFFTFRRKIVYLRGSAANEPYRVWAW